jgi:hypothetical protein
MGDIVETILPGTFGVKYEITEPRRMWNVTISGVPVNAAALLALKNKNGIGGPGEWSNPLKSTTPIWNSFVGQQTEYSVIPETPIPMRRLLPTETYQIGPFGAKIYQRGDSFQAAQTTLADIMAQLQKMSSNNTGPAPMIPQAVLSSILATNTIVRAIATQWSVTVPPGV